MKFTIKAGGEIDLLTKKEMQEALDESFAKAFGTAEYRRIPWSTSGVSLATPRLIQGPDAGFIWSIKLISAVNTASQNLLVYTDDVTDSNLVGFSGASNYQVLTYTSNTLVLKGGQALYLTSTGTGSAAGLIQVKQVSVQYEHLL